MNLPDDWGAYFRKCPRGHLWHESEGHRCLRCSYQESDEQAKRAYWPLDDGGFTLCPDWPPSPEMACLTCGWPRDRHIPH